MDLSHRCVPFASFAVATLVVLTLSRPVLANPSARLVYSRGAEALTCPTEEAVRSAVATRLGYDPFFPWAPTTVVVDVEGANQRFRATDSGSPATCVSEGIKLDTIATSADVSRSDYAYGPSSTQCGGFAAQELRWIQADPGGYIGLFHQVPVANFAGQTTTIKIFLRGESVGGVILEANESDDNHEPVGFATSEGSLVIHGSFDWTQYALVVDTPSNASYFDVAVLLEDAGTLDIASVEVSAEP